MLQIIYIAYFFFTKKSLACLRLNVLKLPLHLLMVIDMNTIQAVVCVRMCIVRSYVMEKVRPNRRCDKLLDGVILKLIVLIMDDVISLCFILASHILVEGDRWF
jgi:hypothetical protein